MASLIVAMAGTALSADVALIILMKSQRTGLDAQTAGTDSSGRFFLETGTQSTAGINSCTITVTKGGTYKDFGPWSWGDQATEQTFAMN